MKIDNDTVVIDAETTKLAGFRLEDTVRAPAVILFVDDRKPELLPLAQGQTPPSRVRSRNMEAAIEIITLEEITKDLQG